MMKALTERTNLCTLKKSRREKEADNGLTSKKNGPQPIAMAIAIDVEKRFCESNHETTGRCGGNNDFFFSIFFFTETETLYYIQMQGQLMAERKVEKEYEHPPSF